MWETIIYMSLLCTITLNLGGYMGDSCSVPYGQRDLRTLFNAIIEAYPDCPKNVVIGKLIWQWNPVDSANSILAQQEGVPDYGKKAFWLSVQSGPMRLQELVQHTNTSFRQRVEPTGQQNLESSTALHCPTEKQEPSKPVNSNKLNFADLDQSSMTVAAELNGNDSDEAKIIFSKETIEQFVFHIGDENPIHRAPTYIVPGCLILETLLLLLGSKEICVQDLTLKCKRPIYADQVIDLNVDCCSNTITATVQDSVVCTAQYRVREQHT